MNTIKEQDILDKSKIALSSLFGIKIDIEDSSISNDDSTADGHITMNSNTFSYVILSNATIGRLSKKIQNHYYTNNGIKNPLIILEHASKELIDFFKQKNLFFIDSSGNCYINLPDFKIFVEGRKSDFIEPIKTKRAFQKTGLKLIFQLLNNPKLAHFSYREISQKTGISLASVSYIFDELKEGGFIMDISHNKRNLSNIKRLITKWSNSYAEILRPKIHRGFFTSINPDFNKNSFHYLNNCDLDHVFIGGEYAASYLNGSIKPSKIILYTNERLSKMAKKYGIVPSGKQHGEKIQIEILEKFWVDIVHLNTDAFQSDSLIKNKNLVDPILIYSDLISSNDYRSVETAEEILNHEIRNRFIKYNFQW